MKLPLKGSKEYRWLVSLTGLAIGLAWVAKDEYEHPKWTGIPRAAEMAVSDLSEWNRQFGPTDVNKWAIPASENEAILKRIEEGGKPQDLVPTKNTW